jgi:hypothetical protein
VIPTQAAKPAYGRAAPAATPLNATPGPLAKARHSFYAAATCSAPCLPLPHVRCLGPSHCITRAPSTSSRPLRDSELAGLSSPLCLLELCHAPPLLRQPRHVVLTYNALPASTTCVCPRAASRMDNRSRTSLPVPHLGHAADCRRQPPALLLHVHVQRPRSAAPSASGTDPLFHPCPARAAT